MKKISKSTFAGLVATVVLLAVGNMHAAENAEQTFKSLFGDQMRKVASTSKLADDLALARQIVTAAGENKLPADLLTVMYNAAFGLAAKAPDGYAVASEAMRLLGKSVPAQEIKARQNMLDLMLKRLRIARTLAQRQAKARPYVYALMKLAGLLEKSGQIDLALTYSRKALMTAISFKLSDATEIRAENTRLTILRAAVKRRELLEKKLKTDPADAETRKKLIDLHLINLDDPAAASKLFTADSDELLRTYVSLAMKPVDQIETATLGELAKWYVQLADGVLAKTSKVAMLRRAEGFSLRFMDVYTEKDTKRLKVAIGLASIRRKLTALGQGAGPGTVARPTFSGRWPGSTTGLVFVWRDSTSSIKLTPRGKANITKGKAMSLTQGAFIAAPSVNAKLLAACRKSNAFTIEAMIKPGNLSQGGPARIISFSQDGHVRNFTLGQDANKLVIRLRTVSTSDQNTTLVLFKMREAKWHHVVVTYRMVKDAKGKTRGVYTAYVNGRAATTGSKKGGKLSGWTPMHLLFGDEFAEKRDWGGQLKGIAIYSRAISAEEITAKAKAKGITPAAK